MGIKRLRASVFLLALVAAWCLAGGAAWALDIDVATIAAGFNNGVDTSNVPHLNGGWVYKVDDPSVNYRFYGTQMDIPDTKIHRSIHIDGKTAPAGHTFHVTLDNMTLASCPIAIQIYNGANVDLHIKGKNTIYVPNYTNGYGSVALIHVGHSQNANAGASHVDAKPSKLRIIGDGKDASFLTLDYSSRNYSTTDGADGIRASHTGSISTNGLSFKDVNITIEKIAHNNRGICGDTSGDVTFDSCYVDIDGGIPISGGIAGLGIYSNMHFINCALSLNATYSSGGVGAIFLNKTGPNARKVIFCDTQDNIAIVKATGANDAVVADTIEIAGGAVRLTAASATQYGVNANHVNIVSQDVDGHPDGKEQGSIIFYADRMNGVGEIHVDDSVNAIVASKNNRRDETTPEYQDWSARTPASGTGSYTIGNVVGDFELFDTRIDKTVLGEPDYTIHDGEVIIVDKGNTLTINDMSKFVIEKDGHLVLIGDGNINDGVIEVHGRTDDELKQMIRDEFGGKLGGSGSILNADTGTMLTNSGTSWDELVDNTDTAERAKINNDGTPNLVVFGKNDTTGKDALVAVNPKTKDDPYLVPLNERLDLKVVITEPGNDKKVQNTSSHNGKFMSAAVWPLDASGNPLGPVDTASRVPTINPLPVTKISGGMTQFTLSEDDIRKLREYAKQNGLQEFVIWVYEVDTINDTDYNGTGLKMPFVFKVDSPEHTFSTSVPADQKSNIVQDANTLVRVNVTQQAGTPLAEYRALNPTRSDVISLTENEDVLPEVYIARNAGDTKLNTNSGFEGKSVLASIRPYDGLSMSQYKGLGDFIESDGPKPITDGYAGFQFDYKSLHRWARRLRLREFIVYLRDVETNGGLIESEFVVRLGEADVDTHGTHCAGCDTGAGIAFAAGALAVVAMRRRKES